ncbi:MAG: sugar isomerase domain-containing protein [Clostridia bacterium]|nr:sugar isomerase domain-containing protein [Clostridia bacterium]
MGLLERYQDRVEELIHTVRETQHDNIKAAGRLMAESIENGGVIFVSPVVHGADGDVLYRGGGPLFYKRFNWKLNVESTSRTRDRSGIDTNMEGLGAYVIKASSLKPGDVLIVSSVSGRTANVVDLAYEAKKMGIKVIAFTSMAYAKEVDAVHSSGLKLYEIADLTMDNCAPPAEGMLQVDGIEAPFAAASGIASDYLLWCMAAETVEILLSHGKTPAILKSANYPGGNDYNKKVMEPQYEKLGW